VTNAPVRKRRFLEGGVGYVIARSIGEAVALLQEGAVAFAGGTLLGPWVRDGVIGADVVDVRGLVEFRNVDRADDCLKVGAAVSLTAFAAAAGAVPGLAGAQEAALNIGNPHIRGVGTVGGNVASYRQHTDLPTALLALDARLFVAGASAQTVDISLADYLGASVPDGRLIIALTIDGARRRSAYVKTAWRRATAPAVATVAVSARPVRDVLVDVRIVVGSVASPRPLRIADAEVPLEGKRADNGRVAAAAERAAATIVGEAVSIELVYLHSVIVAAVGQAIERVGRR
jgi:aerobic carbon-monoxide dehydrogenase medium subunit